MKRKEKEGRRNERNGMNRLKMGNDDEQQPEQVPSLEKELRLTAKPDTTAPFATFEGQVSQTQIRCKYERRPMER